MIYFVKKYAFLYRLDPGHSPGSATLPQSQASTLHFPFIFPPKIILLKNIFKTRVAPDNIWPDIV